MTAAALLTTAAKKGLNCLSAVEAIGSAVDGDKNAHRDVQVSIAFRLLKRLVVRKGEVLIATECEGVSIAFRLLKRLVAVATVIHSQVMTQPGLNCLSAVEAIGR